MMPEEAQKLLKKIHANKKQITIGCIFMAVSALVFIIFLINSYLYCVNVSCRVGGFEIMLLAPIFLVVFLGALISAVGNSIQYRKRKRELKNLMPEWQEDMLK